MDVDVPILFTGEMHNSPPFQQTSRKAGEYEARSSNSWQKSRSSTSRSSSRSIGCGCKSALTCKSTCTSTFTCEAVRTGYPTMGVVASSSVLSCCNGSKYKDASSLHPRQGGVWEQMIMNGTPIQSICAICCSCQKSRLLLQAHNVRCCCGVWV